MAADDAQNHYPPELFRRQDESDDRLFYAEPRLVVHIDYEAIGAISAYFREALPSEGVILDLMSSWAFTHATGPAGQDTHRGSA